MWQQNPKALYTRTPEVIPVLVFVTCVERLKILEEKKQRTLQAAGAWQAGAEKVQLISMQAACQRGLQGEILRLGRL